jgi:3-hydroxyacyl-[acyl-carrier-protein] dehydratase
MQKYQSILDQLPYQHPFLFVDEITEIDLNSIKGFYFFHNQHDFYKGHFKDFPITPGVILTECAAQIGLACFGIFLLKTEGKSTKNLNCVMTSTEIEFLKPVFPNETIQVEAEKQYFRFNKLKSSVKLYNSVGELVLKGQISGMISTEKHE